MADRKPNAARTGIAAETTRMRKLITTALLFALFIGAYALCWGKDKAMPLQIVVTEAVLKPNGVLQCKWRIRNTGQEVVHVYATFLNGSSDDMLDVVPSRTALVRTTWLREVKAYPAYYLPKAEFLDVAPGAEITGSLERRPRSRQTADQLRTLKFVVAYGADVDRLKIDIQQSLAKGTEFQGNAIVRWQSLAYSAPVEVVQR